jgi:hypothetical protein
VEDMTSVIQEIINSNFLSEYAESITKDKTLASSFYSPSRSASQSISITSDISQKNPNIFAEIKISITTPAELMKRLTPKTLLEFIEIIKKRLNFHWTYRDIRRYLNRYSRFIERRVTDDTELEEIRSITASDIALSFIIAGPVRNIERIEMFESFFF